MNDGHISKNIDLVNFVIELVAARCLSPGGLPKYSAKCTQTERDGWNAMANFSRTRPKSWKTAQDLGSTNWILGKPRETLLKMELKIPKTYQCWHVTIFLAGFQTAFPCLVYSTEESESRVDDGGGGVAQQRRRDMMAATESNCTHEASRRADRPDFEGFQVFVSNVGVFNSKTNFLL